MVVQNRKGCLVFVILFLSPTPYLTCDILPTVRIFGHYCPNFDKLESWNLPPPECTLLCMQRIGCIAANYNSSDGTCQLLPATCPQASDDPAMTYTIYTRIDLEQCLEWIDHSRGIPVDARWVMTKIGGDEEKRRFARMIYDGDYYPSHYTPRYDECFCTDGTQPIRSGHGHPCQLLRIKEGCTMAFIWYRAGDALPVGATAVTNLAQLEIRYIAAIESSTGEFDGQGLSGMYTKEAGCAIYYDHGIKYSTNMKLMIII